MKWIKCKDRLPDVGVTVWVWCAESSFYTGGMVEASREFERIRGTEEHRPRWDADNSRFSDETQDPEVFVTHWTAVQPPADVPDAVEMRKLLKEDACPHGVDWADRCSECDNE